MTGPQPTGGSAENGIDRDGLKQTQLTKIEQHVLFLSARQTDEMIHDFRQPDRRQRRLALCKKFAHTIGCRLIA